MVSQSGEGFLNKFLNKILYKEFPWAKEEKWNNTVMLRRKGDPPKCMKEQDKNLFYTCLGYWVGWIGQKLFLTKTIQTQLNHPKPCGKMLDKKTISKGI